MAGFARTDDMPAEWQAILKEVRGKKELGGKFRQPYEDRWRRYGGLYRSVRRLQSQYAQDRNDRDGTVQDALREWGAELFIPLIFGTVETVIPQALSNDPRMLAIPKPDAKSPEESVERVKERFAQDQAKFDYELVLQDVFRSGEVFGLGVQKMYWKNEQRSQRYNAPKLLGRGYQTKEKLVTVYDAPCAEWVDLWNFFWDPAARNIAECEWVIHRTYRSFDYVANMVKSGKWADLDLEEVKKMQPDEAPGTAQASRMTDWGFPTYSNDLGSQHEIWEYHTGTKVCTILDGKLVVQEDINPAFHNQIPFQIFRPQRSERAEFVGIPIPEQLEHLQYELNSMRSQRIDAATLALQMPIAYQDGMVDPDDIVLGPGLTFGTIGNPQEALYPLKLPDLPESSYRETGEIKSDAQFTTGISDVSAGGTSDEGSVSTATGAQLTVAAAAKRVQLHTKNLERETLRRAASQMLDLYGQHVLDEQHVAVENEESPGTYSYNKITPEDIAAIADVIPDGGSTLAENDAQKVQNATALHNLFAGAEGIDQQKLDEYVLKEFGIPNPGSWVLKESADQMLQKVAHQYVSEGIPQETVLDAIQKAVGAIHQQAPPPPRESISINYADAPPDIQRQMEAAVGFTPAEQELSVDQKLEAQQQQLDAEQAAADQAAQEQQQNNGSAPTGAAQGG